jgi:hypothetical protein
MKMTELRGYRKPRRPSLIEILCQAWTGALIDWGSAELLPDRSQSLAKSPCCDRGLLVYHDQPPFLIAAFMQYHFIDMNG